MANIDITIPIPILGPGESFIVKYRAVGSPTWIDISPKTNAQFTITGLAEGDYELYTALVKADSPATVCPAKIDPFTIKGAADCMDYHLYMTQSSGVYTLHIDWNVPSPLPSICYLKILYGPAGGFGQTVQIVPFVSPNVNSYLLPASNSNYNVTITQIGCDGVTRGCVDQTVYPPSIPPCTHAVISDVVLQFHSIDGTWWVRMNVTQSSPITTDFIIAYNQSNSVTTGVPDPGGTVHFAATGSTTILTFQVYPNLNVLPTNGIGQITYTGGVTDICGFVSKFTAVYTIS